ncbi:MAG: FAD-dependent oxidoreductase [Eubacteriales bacterium]|nr:FAD-dependent oxidoreductase [Eubacteriales bacterium]
MITNNKKSLIATGDVIVLGGGPAGICAAIAAARRGAAVTLVEKSGCLGGMATLGLVGPIAATKSNSGNDFGGIMRELLDKISETARDICLADSFPEFSPPSARYVFLKTLLDEGVNILFHSLVTGAEAEGGRLRSVELQTKGGARIVEGKVFVDCTGDGDLMEYTGIPYIMGSEAESIRMLEENRLDKIHEMEGSKAEKYINKLQPVSNMFIMGNVNIDDAKGYINRELTFDGLGIPCDEFLKQPYIIDMEGFEPFEDSDRIPLPQGRILFFRTARKGEVVINMTRVRGIDGTDPIQLSHGEIISQLQAYAIIKFLRKYIKGFESSYLIEFAPSTGVRETRRLKGKYVLTADDAINCRKFSDAIACGSYIIDIHDPVGRNKALGGRIKGDCYDIPYRSLICEKMKNILFAGRCISCDHVAHSSLRVMGTCMLTGQAAGTAAAISISKEGTAGDVTLLDGIVIRKCLEADGVRIM